MPICPTRVLSCMVGGMEMLTPESVRARLKAAGAWSNKKLGQHFLVDASVLDSVVEAAELTPTDIVVEVGPGLGVLSRRLLPVAKRVIAFEYDPHMQAILANDLPELEVVGGDVLRTAHKALEGLETYKVVANIPYNITTPLLRLFLEGGVGVLPSSLTLLVQKEIGERLAAGAAKPGRGYLSVLAQYYAEVRFVRDVAPSCFVPPPAVNSAVIHLALRTERALPGRRRRLTSSSSCTVTSSSRVNN